MRSGFLILGNQLFPPELLQASHGLPVVMVALLDRLEPHRRERIFRAAEAFVERVTTRP